MTTNSKFTPSIGNWSPESVSGHQSRPRVCGVLVNHFKTMIKSPWKQHESLQITGGSRTMDSRHPVCHKPCTDPGDAGCGSSLVSLLAWSAEGVDTQGPQHTWKGWRARDRAGGACSGGQACPAGAAVRRSCFFQKEEPERNQGKEVFPTCGCEGLENTVWSPNPGHLCHREPGATAWLWGH